MDEINVCITTKNNDLTLNLTLVLINHSKKTSIILFQICNFQYIYLSSLILTKHSVNDNKIGETSYKKNGCSIIIF